jgi:hypothetical protein
MSTQQPTTTATTTQQTIINSIINQYRNPYDEIKLDELVFQMISEEYEEEFIKFANSLRQQIEKDEQEQDEYLNNAKDEEFVDYTNYVDLYEGEIEFWILNKQREKEYKERIYNEEQELKYLDTKYDLIMLKYDLQNEETVNIYDVLSDVIKAYSIEYSEDQKSKEYRDTYTDYKARKAFRDKYTDYKNRKALGQIKKKPKHYGFFPMRYYDYDILPIKVLLNRLESNNSQLIEIIKQHGFSVNKFIDYIKLYINLINKIAYDYEYFKMYEIESVWHTIN